MDDVTRGLIGRLVCGGIELVFGIYLVIRALRSANSIAIWMGAFIALTGSLGIASKTRNLVIGYLVAGIICAISMAILLIVSGIALNDDYHYYVDSGYHAILIAGMVIVALALTVIILGVIFACLPLCGTTQEQGAVQYQHNTSPNIVLPPAYNQVDTAYPNTKESLV